MGVGELVYTFYTLLLEYIFLAVACSLAEFSFSESLLSCLSASVAMHCHGRGHTTCMYLGTSTRYMY